MTKLVPKPWAICHLRKFRYDFKVSQQIIADALGCTRAYIAYMELGKRIPSLDLAFKLADYFGVTIEEIWERPK